MGIELSHKSSEQLTLKDTPSHIEVSEGFDLREAEKLFREAEQQTKPVYTMIQNHDSRIQSLQLQTSYGILRDKIISNKNNTTEGYKKMLSRFTLLSLGIVHNNGEYQQFEPKSNYKEVIDLYVSINGKKSLLLIDQVLQGMSRTQDLGSPRIKTDIETNQEILQYLYEKIEPHIKTENEIAIFAHIMFGRQHEIPERDTSTLSQSDIAIISQFKTQNYEDMTLLESLKFINDFKLLNPIANAAAGVLDTLSTGLNLKEVQTRLNDKLTYNRVSTDIFVKLLAKSQANALLVKHLDSYEFVVDKIRFINTGRGNIPSDQSIRYTLSELKDFITQSPIRRQQETLKIINTIQTTSSLTKKIVLIELLEIIINHKRYGGDKTYNEESLASYGEEERQKVLSFLSETNNIKGNHMVDLLGDITGAGRLQIADRNQGTFKKVGIVACSIALYYATGGITGELIATCVSSGAYSIIEQKLVQYQNLDPMEIYQTIVISLGILSLFKLLGSLTTKAISPEQSAGIIEKLGEKEGQLVIKALQSKIQEKGGIVVRDILEEVIEYYGKDIKLTYPG